MNPSRWVFLRFKRAGVVALALLASALYIWQVDSAWDMQSRVIKYEADHSSSVQNLKGRGYAAGASATLSYDSSGARAVMQVQDLPVLPAALVYQMWVIADDGKADASSIFRIAVDGPESNTVVMSAPRMLANYHRFRVTIEPAGGSMAPTGPVVLEN